MSTVRFAIDYAKQSRSACKKCKEKIPAGELRIAKLSPNPFSDNAGDMKTYFHPTCIFDSFMNARGQTKVVESPEDLEGWSEVTDDDKATILKKIQAVESKLETKTTSSKTKTTPKKKQGTLDSMLGIKPKTPVKVEEPQASASSTLTTFGLPTDQWVNTDHADNSWDVFADLCHRIAAVSAYNQKSAQIKQFLTLGTDDDEFQGNTYLLIKLLLPGVIKRVYNINSKQIIKHFSQIFGEDADDMLDNLNQGGEVGETIRVFFESNSRLKPQEDSTLNIYAVDKWLDQMTQYTKDDDQINHLTKITKKCTAIDLKFIIRQIKHDLRINSGAKHILDALDPNAYSAFQASRDLRTVIDRLADKEGKLSVDVQLGIPVLPMLAEPCKSVEYAFKKAPNGIFSEVKYDGERVQVHKSGDKFHYFSRSLKPVQPHKVQHFEKFIPDAFPGGKDLILDSEVLLVDTNTSKPLPFGTLGVHKKAAFNHANVCLFIFDCILYNGESLTKKTLVERRNILKENMVEIPNRIMLSEMVTIRDRKHLKGEINNAISEGLEGLVLKDKKSIYEPGKRHWLKVKKDYLKQGTMADSADLIVLGAFFGTGKQGGIMSVYLMGTYDPHTRRFCTVTKCGNGHDDATLVRLDKELQPTMNKINKDYNKVPHWLNISSKLVPDFLVKDPKAAPVWEIAGAEFTKSDSHTANGISIRFPRVTRIRDDKCWDKATNLHELQNLFDTSKEKTDMLDSDSDVDDKAAATTEKSKTKKGKTSTSGIGKKRAAEDTQRSFINDADDAEVPPKVMKQSPNENKTPGSDKKSPTSKSPATSSPGPKKPSPAKQLFTTLKPERDSPAKSEPKSPSKSKDGEEEKTAKSATPTKAQKSPSTTSSRSVSKSPAEESPVAKTTKRKKVLTEDSDSEPEERTETKPKKPQGKVPCKYGSLCYRKNPDHLKDFSHPGDKDEVSDSEEDGFLSGVKFYLATDLPNRKKLVQGICAFGGDVLDEYQSKDASYIVTETKDDNKIPAGELRIAKLSPNPFSDNAGDMKTYFHPTCIFDSFMNARGQTKVVESPEDLEGWSEVTDDDKATILKKIQAVESKLETKTTSSQTKTTPKKKQGTLDSMLGIKPKTPVKVEEPQASASSTLTTFGLPTDQWVNTDHADNSWDVFADLCHRIAAVSAYNQKSAQIKQFLTLGTDDDEFQGNTYLLIKLLLPGVIKRVYNINSKQIIKHFSQIFGEDADDMLDNLNQGGEVGETIRVFFESNSRLKPQEDSTLNIYAVDKWLDQMTQYTKDDDQINHLTKITKKCTAIDLKFIIRQIKHDLRINSGAKHILDALDPNAYSAFQASRDLRTVIDRLADKEGKLSVDVQLGIPVLPMLAEPCKSVEYAFKKAPNGIFSEVKYDGERVQVHKSGDKFHYFSRSLKPVQPHKVQHFEKFIPDAFPGGKDLILDSEVLLVDTNTSKPLPFGTLGVHKKAAFNHANVCLFIFDCILYNGESLTKKTLVERRNILKENMVEIPNRIMLSEMVTIRDRKHLKGEINNAISEGLEGLVLKDKKSIYEPGKRHWLKVKKDYLKQGTMADSADLIVLGAFFGTGKQGGIMSVYLMGTYDPHTRRFCTVTKCGNGHDDATLVRLDKELQPTMNKINKDYNKVPHWLNISSKLVPDFLVKDPKAAPVWEIAGAEFTKSDSHTANGISIRFPRVTRIRDDKCWDKATNLHELQNLFDTSKEKTDMLDSDSDVDDKAAATTEKSKTKKGKTSTSGIGKKRAAEDTQRSFINDADDAEVPPKVMKQSPNENKTPGSDKKSPTSKSPATSSPGPKKPSPAKQLFTTLKPERDSPAKSEPKSPSKSKDGEEEKTAKSATPTKAQKSPSTTSSRSVSKSPAEESPMAKTTKRKKVLTEDSDSEPEERTETKPKKPQGKVPCKYGSLCYRKNPDHLKDFSHPGDKDEVSDSEEDGFLSGVKFYLATDLPNRKKLVQGICAFGGDVLDEYQSKDASYIVTETKHDNIEDIDVAANTSHRDVAWLKNCLKTQEIE